MTEIANKIMLLGRWERYKNTGRSVAYRAACDCTDSDCDITIDLEYDSRLKTVDLNFYKDVYFFDGVRRCVLWDENIVKKLRDEGFKEAFDAFVEDGILYYVRNFWYRFKKAVRLMFTGYLKMNESFLFQGEEQIDAFIKALQQGKEYVLSNEGNDDKTLHI